MVKTRHATNADIPRLVDLYRQLELSAPRPFGVKTLKLILRASTKRVIVAEHSSNGVVGLIEVTIGDCIKGASTEKFAYFDYVVVDKHFRELGIGRSLYLAATKELRKEGYYQFYAEVLVDNLRAQSFHEELGFKKVEKVIRYSLNLNH